ncbi:heparin lyase I family protein [Zooshikella marina]|uniref:heparin lyase I family protein n=1 Tax=Zooshikella ganghwensis TaxID=202772 RepID=UPI001BAFEBA9|nr:heparin lyase I family protein [Zooshikella ganghwensis]MBU2705652.1 heparin lyase I family protein [Zooshikella ganghwensis]
MHRVIGTLALIITSNPALQAQQSDLSFSKYVQANCYISPLKIVGKINPQTYLIDEQCILNHQGLALAPVGTRHPLGRLPDHRQGFGHVSITAIPKNILPEFGSLADGRQRVEFTTGFYRLSQYYTNPISDTYLNYKQSTKSMMSGQWPTNTNPHLYKIRFRLPSQFRDEFKKLHLPKTNKASILSDDMSVIIAQWHGIPDRLTYRHQTDLPHQYQTLTTNPESDTALGETLTHYKKLKQQGYLFDQGGFPPLALKIKDGQLALIANYFRYPVHDRRLTRCPKIALSGNQAAKPSQFYICNYKTKQLKKYEHLQEEYTSSSNAPWASGVSLVWKTPITDALFDQWHTLTLYIDWPEWKQENNNVLKKGRVLLFNSDTGEQLADFYGPLGNNDQWKPYFKFGIYKSNNSQDLPVQVDYDLSSFLIL